MIEDKDIMDGFEDAYRDGLVNVEHPGDPEEDPKFRLSEHGEAYSRDLLRENPKAVALVAGLVVREAEDGEYNEALFDVAKQMAQDAGVNLYAVIREHPELFPWLTDDAVTKEMANAMEEHVHD